MKLQILHTTYLTTLLTAVSITSNNEVHYFGSILGKGNFNYVQN
jgi:hypothetical protein